MACAVCLMLAGALLRAVFFALLTQRALSRRIEESLGRQRITGLTGHVLVIGLGAVGMRVVQQLIAAGRDIVVVEKSEHNRTSASSARSACRWSSDATAAGDAGVGPAHQRLRGGRRDQPTDANLETGLAVRDQLGARWETTPVVLRIFDPQLARSVKSSFGSPWSGRTAALAAPMVRGRRARPDVPEHVLRGDVPLLVARLTVTPTAACTGWPCTDLGPGPGCSRCGAPPTSSSWNTRPGATTRFVATTEAYLIAVRRTAHRCCAATALTAGACPRSAGAGGRSLAARPGCSSASTPSSRVAAPLRQKRMSRLTRVVCVWLDTCLAEVAAA